MSIPNPWWWLISVNPCRNTFTSRFYTSIPEVNNPIYSFKCQHGLQWSSNRCTAKHYIHYIAHRFRGSCPSDPSTSNIYLRKIHSTGSLDWCMLHCSGTPCRLNCLTTSVSLSPVAGKSERATLDWVWLWYFAQLEFLHTKQSLAITSIVLGIVTQAKQAE